MDRLVASRSSVVVLHNICLLCFDALWFGVNYLIGAYGYYLAVVLAEVPVVVVGRVLSLLLAVA